MGAGTLPRQPPGRRRYLVGAEARFNFLRLGAALKRRSSTVLRAFVDFAARRAAAAYEVDYFEAVAFF